jgi:hypothetical protein
MRSVFSIWRQTLHLADTGVCQMLVRISMMASLPLFTLLVALLFFYCYCCCWICFFSFICILIDEGWNVLIAVLRCSIIDKEMWILVLVLSRIRLGIALGSPYNSRLQFYDLSECYMIASRLQQSYLASWEHTFLPKCMHFPETMYDSLTKVTERTGKCPFKPAGGSLDGRIVGSCVRWCRRSCRCSHHWSKRGRCRLKKL